jgi:hypothetical protein
LPEGWTAWHSLRVHAARGAEGEGDFVLAVPHRGVILLEVKGGQVELRGGHWYQNGKRLSAAPREQAHGFSKTLRQQLGARFPGERLPFVVIATAFPETAWEEPPSNGDLEGAVLGAQDLAFLREALEALAERLFQPREAPSWDWVSALHELWGETWIPEPTLGWRTQEAEVRRVALDAQQLAAIRALTSNPRVLVQGGPGSGKTLLALEVAKRWQAAARAPLLLCFTRALALEFRAAGRTAWTVRDLAAELVRTRSLPVSAASEPARWSAEEWSEATLLAAAEVERSPFPCDAVIVDEAQDLEAADWALVRALAGQGPLWIFADEGQGFWPARSEIPAEVRPPFTVVLETRYRCPPAIAAFAELYRTGAPASKPVTASPELELLITSAAELEGACAAALARLAGAGIARRHIAVISLAGQTRTRLGAATHIGSVPVVRADAGDAREELVADTFLRFKGLERPWVVLVELGLVPMNYDVRMHIALTRATAGCIILATPEELAQDARLASLERVGLESKTLRGEFHE